MRRPALRSTLAALAPLAALVLVAAPAGAQTTTTTTPVTTVPTTTPVTAPPTTPGGGGTVTTAGDGTVTTEAPATPTTATSGEGSGDGSDIPWIPIAVGAVVLGLLLLLVALLARRRGAARQQTADWRHGAADTTAEAGALSRLLAQGTPPSGQIAQQLAVSLRAFEDLARTAPTEADGSTAERARRALQTLGLAIDADYRLRRAGGTDPEQVARSAEAVQNAATEADRTLRGVYRAYTTTD
jgi:hypothetical protein